MKEPQSAHAAKKTVKKDPPCAAGAKTPKRRQPAPKRSSLIKPMVYNERKPHDAMFVVHDTVFSQIKVGASVIKGLRLAQHVLESSFYIDMLCNAGIVDKKRCKEVQNKLRRVQITIKLIQRGSDLDSFACVYRETSANTVYFNPLLLMKLALREHEKKGKRKQDFVNFASRFIMAEAIHEMTHHVNGEFNSFFAAHPLVTVSPTMSLKLPGTNKLTFSDYGYIAEVGITGFISECRPNSEGDIFGLDGIVLYPSESDQDNNRGFVAAVSNVDLELCDIDKDSTPFRYIVAKTYDGKSFKHSAKVPFPARHSSASKGFKVDAEEQEGYGDDLGPSRR